MVYPQTPVHTHLGERPGFATTTADKEHLCILHRGVLAAHAIWDTPGCAQKPCVLQCHDDMRDTHHKYPYPATKRSPVALYR